MCYKVCFYKFRKLFLIEQEGDAKIESLRNLEEIH